MQILSQPIINSGYKFSRGWHRVHVFPRLAPGACFLRLATVARFTALDTTCMFFPALQGTGYMFFPVLQGTGWTFSCAWYRLHVNAARLALVSSFATRGSSIVSRGTSYEALQVSKAITKSQKFMLKAPQPCKIFCFTSNNWTVTLRDQGW